MWAAASAIRAVTDVFEPGSTAKPFTVAAALETGKFRTHSLIDTKPGFMKIGDHKVTDVRNFGTIDVATVLKKSSNVGASKIALALEPEHLWDTFQSVGFGAPTGSGFPGESGGILTDFYGWSELERATLSFGYGFSVTPLQLAQAYSVVASGGLMYPVTFVKSDSPEEPQRVLAAHAALQVRGMLEAVTQEGGTARRASISGYRVAGKNGHRPKVDGGWLLRGPLSCRLCRHGSGVLSAIGSGSSLLMNPKVRNTTAGKSPHRCLRK